MSQRRKKNNKEEEPGVGAAIAAGAAVAGLAALVYGAKKLYDYVSEEQPKQMTEGCSSSSSCSSSNYGNSSYGNSSYSTSSYGNSSYASPPERETRRSHVERRDPSEYHDELRPAKVEPTQPKTNRQPSRSLSSYLNAYRCYADPGEMTTDVCHVLEAVTSGLTGRSSLLHVFPMVTPSQVVAITTARYRVSLVADSTNWQLQAAGEGFDVVRLDNQHIDNYDELTTENGSARYLSPDKVSDMVNQSLLSLMMEIRSRFPHCSVTLSGCNVTVTSGDDTVTADFTPTLTIPDTRTDSDMAQSGVARLIIVKPDQNGFWQRDYSTDDVARLYTMSPDHCCHLDCLRIMTTVALNHPQHFNHLDPYVYRAILLAMMSDTPEEDFWRHECLPEQFVDMLSQLVYHLQARRLPHPHQPEVNLLNPITPETCDTIAGFILDRIGKETLPSLLTIPE